MECSNQFDVLEVDRDEEPEVDGFNEGKVKFVRTPQNPNGLWYCIVQQQLNCGGLRELYVNSKSMVGDFGKKPRFLNRGDSVYWERYEQVRSHLGWQIKELFGAQPLQEFENRIDVPANHRLLAFCKVQHYE